MSVIQGKRSILSSVLVLLAFVSLVAGSMAQGILAEGPWPMTRRDPAHTGRSQLNGPASGTVAWTFSAGRNEDKGGIETDPTIGPEGTIYIGANNGILYVLDGNTGEVRWAFPTLFDLFAIYSTVALDRQGHAYFGAKDGYLYALKAPEKGLLGREVWSYRIGTTIETSPLLGRDGTVYLGADDGKLYAVAPPAGGKPPRLLWTFPTGGTLISSPALGPDGTLYIGSMDGKLYALEPAPAGAKLRWSFSTGKSGETGGIENSPAVGPDGTVYVGANDGLLYALDGKSGQLKWNFKTGYTSWAIFSSAAIGPDGTIYFGAKDGRLYAVQPPASGTTAKALWSYKIGTTIKTSPALGADGTVYLGADDGKLYAIAPTKGFFGLDGKLLWSYQTKSKLISSPAIGEGRRLYVGSLDGTLYAFGDKPAPSGRSGGISGTWYGSFFDSRTKGTLTLVLRQRGSTVEGIWRLGPSGARGELSGRAEGEKAAFSLKILGDRCPGSFEGTARIEPAKIVGQYQGSDCKGAVTKGQFEASR